MTFPLERLDDILLKITPKTLGLLIFIKKEVMPIREKKVKQIVSEQKPDTKYHSIEWFLDMERKRTDISSTINTWIYDNYNPNSSRVKERYNLEVNNSRELQSEIFEIERKKRDEVYDGVDELVNLGILKMKVSGGGFGGGAGSSYDFSQLGYHFIEYLPKA